METNAILNLERRTTRKYRAAYSYLDDSGDVGTARVLSTCLTTDRDGDAKEKLVLRVRSTADKEAVQEAIFDTMRHQCQCEHDCCGHLQTHVSRARKTPKQNLWVVMLSHYRNI